MNTDIVGEFTQSETKICFISGGHRHIISPFYAVMKEAKRSIGSHTFQIGDHSWQIVCYPNGETPDVKDFVSLFLGYRGPDKDCFAHWRLTLVNQDDPAQSRTRAWLKGDRFNKFLTGRRWGWQRFIRREDLMDPDKGFIKDGTVIFEASLDVFLKQTQTVIFEDRFDFDLYPIPRCQIHTDFGFFFNEGKMKPSGRVGLLADSRFKFPDKTELYAHSQILSARSPVFLKLFTNSFVESTTRKRVMDISLGDVSRDIFVEVLRFIYCGKVNWKEACKDLLGKTKNKRLSDAVVSLSRDCEPIKKKKRGDLFSRSVDLPSSDESEDSRPYSADPSMLNAGRRGKQDFVKPSSSTFGSRGSVIAATEQQMKILHFALGVYEAADKYELNRLRLIAEHKILAILKNQINRINSQIMLKTQRFYEITQYVSQEYGTPVGNRFCTTTLPYKYIVSAAKEDLVGEQESDELWSNGFMDVLAVADRHNSTRLKRLCLSALTSNAISKRTKQKLLSDKMLDTLSKPLITEMLQYVTIRETRSVDDEQPMPQFGILGAVPEGGKELLDEKEAYEIERHEERQPSAMHVAELKSELVERGFPIRGSRAALVTRLEEARGLRVLFQRGKK